MWHKYLQGQINRQVRSQFPETVMKGYPSTTLPTGPGPHYPQACGAYLSSASPHYRLSWEVVVLLSFRLSGLHNHIEDRTNLPNWEHTSSQHHWRDHQGDTARSRSTLPQAMGKCCSTQCGQKPPCRLPRAPPKSLA